MCQLIAMWRSCAVCSMAEAQLIRVLVWPLVTYAVEDSTVDKMLGYPMKVFEVHIVRNQ